MRSSSERPAPFQATLYPFGFAVSIESYSRLPVEIAREEWGVWRQAFHDPPVKLSFDVLATGEPVLRGAPMEFRNDQHCFHVIRDLQSRASGDTRAGTAAATVEQSVVEDSPYFVYYFLESLAFQLITSRYFAPLHAACVARGDRAVLLACDSGGGKTSLAYACARAGWTYVSDDASPLLRRCGPARKIIGSPHHIRFRPDARELFPELARFEPAMRGNGKLSLQIPTRDLEITTAPAAFADAIVLPRRVSREHPSSPARLAPIDQSTVRELCEKWFYRWDPPVYAEQQAAFEELLPGVRTFSLEYSELDAAVEALNDAL